jgi:hypothetical protein
MISKSYSLTDARQVVVAANDLYRSVYLQIVGNTTIYVGGADVTSSNGLPYAKHSSPHTVEVPIGETLYAVCATAETETLRVLLPNLD